MPIYIYDNKKDEIIDNPKKVKEILQQYGITEKDIKNDAKFVLKDVILKDWFKLNGNKSRYNLKNWGKLSYNEDDITLGTSHQ